MTLNNLKEAARFLRQPLFYAVKNGINKIQTKAFLSVLLVLISAFATQLKAQEDLIFYGQRHKIGFITGYGNQSQLNVDYTYNVTFFSPQYYYTFLIKPTWGLEVLAQPQYNLTRYKKLITDAELQRGYEFGLNMGLLARKNFFNDKASFYGLLSSGPHYVSDVPARQVPGFIFSDNLFVGINIRAYKQIYIDTRLGIRHISNASLKKPNGGVNNLVLNAGFFYSFRNL